MSEHVILLHGIWMRAFTMSVLRGKLERAGFDVSVFDYASVLRDPQATVALLDERIRRLSAPRVHMIGHSLGGLIALQALQCAPELTRGHVVCIGSPLRGSVVARTVAHAGGSVLMGKSADMLRSGLERWNGPQAVGAIAGSRPMGIGLAIRALSSPHDGTVSVAETELPGLTDHVIVPATHTGLLFSQEAAEQTISFLRAARFRRAA